MTFRDDHEATRARADALEQELAEARSELATHRASAAKLPASRTPGGATAAIALLAGALAAFAAALYAGFVIGGREAEVLGIVLGGIGAVIVCLAASVALVSRFLVVVAPNQLAVLSGRSHRAADGSTVGFRILRGGRALRLPLLERLDFMDLSSVPIEVELSSCHARGGAIAIRIRAGAKIIATEPHVGHAIERFLGQDRGQIVRVVEQTLEGAVRRLIAQRTVEQVRDDRAEVTAALTVVLEPELQKLGVVVEALTIMTVDGA